MKEKEKVCKVCFERKDLRFFTKHNGYANLTCNECKNMGVKLNTEKFAAKSFGNQVRNCKQRGHSLPKYGKLEFMWWLTSNPLFKKLHKEWVDSGFDKDLAPSVDRLDDYKTYSFDNIRIATWKENREKNYSDTVRGINRKRLKPILQVSKKDGIVAEFISASDAERRTGIPKGSIRRALAKAEPHGYGYGWIFKNDYEKDNSILERVRDKIAVARHAKSEVQQIEDGKVIAEFDNLTIASRETGICKSTISQVCNKREYRAGKVRKRAGGYHWRYKEK